MAKTGILLSVVALASAASAFGQIEMGPYFRTGLGVNLAEDLEGEITGVAGAGPGGTAGDVDFAYEFDPGVRLDLAPGVKLCPYFGLELNTGLIWNGIDSIKVSPGRASVEGDLLQVPIMGNAVLSHTFGNIRPFIGGGGGGVYQYLSLDSIGGMQMDSSEDDVYVAFQGFAGVQYEIGDGASVGVSYTYMRALTEESGAVPGAEGGSVEDMDNHAISLSFLLEF